METNMGWQCPVCKSVWSPEVKTCSIHTQSYVNPYPGVGPVGPAVKPYPNTGSGEWYATYGNGQLKSCTVLHTIDNPCDGKF